MDEWLMGKVASGDKESFSLLIERHQEFVLSVTYQFLSVREDAEDVAQEVFIKLYQKSSSYKSQGKFRAYLAKIATNECLNKLRQQKKMQMLPLDEQKLRENCLASKKEDLSQILHQTLNQLPQKQRLAFLMKIHGGFSYDTISKELKCPKTAIGGLIFRARQTLQQKLKRVFTEALS